MTSDQAWHSAAGLTEQSLPEANTDPFKFARAFADTNAKDRDGTLIIRFWRGGWYRYEEGRYVERDEVAMTVVLTGFMKRYIDDNHCVDKYGNAIKVTKALVGNTLNALRAIVVVSEHVEVFTWLGDEEAGPFIATKNGLLDVKDLPQAPVRLRDNSPLWFSTIALPYEYDSQARCPRWLGFLNQVMERDSGRIGLLQQWAGYLLLADTSQHKFMIAEGDGANGKSVFLEVLTAMLGRDNVAHVPLELFGERFQLTATLHKLANICAEVGDIGKVAEGHLKQFTSTDRMHFDRKFLTPVSMYPTARLMLSTNARPQFRDRSGGLWRRLILVPFRVVIPAERQDRDLVGKLITELPGILNWALDGLRDLRAQGRLEIPPICQELMDEYQAESNPAKVFLREACREEPGTEVESSGLYKQYRKWCVENGFDVLDAGQFGKEVKRAFPAVTRKRGQKAVGRPWLYRGLSWLS